MLDINELKNGLTVKLEGAVYLIVDFQQVKPGKGAAFVRTRLKNMRTGAVLDRTFRSGDKVEEAFVHERKLQYLYQAGETFHFMDMETYEQHSIEKDQMGETPDYLKENMIITLLEHEGQVLDVSPPMFVELKVVNADPGLRGDTAKGGNKFAKLETGASIQVPLFVKEGDIIKVDTRTGSYVNRV
ncbi:MAG: elongation factor P [Candidatus Omnitrophica bacterium]|nr:elongation factor P [Candidatus Omnitrophota bacterium]